MILKSFIIGLIATIFFVAISFFVLGKEANKIKEKE